ncbi:hypothetical protein JL193_08735 [Polaribacter batillariae]|uniref:Uncharacterized protein n=1 Tax=Polaribacter batillariae TaxID=2808900 RepID=A0ABX7SQX0_9FLAO|nr:hypothetical protein [Polaribacter batillariae]QTD36252.1 hypothetical protein JL193_08735 [Polaribacter batillariae]
MKQKKGLPILFWAIVVCGFWSFTSPQENETDFTERAKIALREVGHQLLLANKDSLSLILPIKKIEAFKYQISFEKPLSFEPSTLVKIIKEVFKKTHFHKNYRVEVVETSLKEVVYSYEINIEEEKTIIPCAGRFLPEKEYKIEVKFLDIETSSNYMWWYILIPLILGILYRRFFLDKNLQKIKNRY